MLLGHEEIEESWGAEAMGSYGLMKARGTEERGWEVEFGMGYGGGVNGV